MENKVISTEYVKKNFIHKDKIKEKVQEIKDAYVEDMFLTSTRSKLDIIIVLESLLEETNEQI